MKKKRKKKKEKKKEEEEEEETEDHFDDDDNDNEKRKPVFLHSKEHPHKRAKKEPAIQPSKQTKSRPANRQSYLLNDLMVFHITTIQPNHSPKDSRSYKAPIFGGEFVERYYLNNIVVAVFVSLKHSTTQTNTQAPNQCLCALMGNGSDVSVARLWWHHSLSRGAMLLRPLRPLGR
uniref:Uncharacterized protein n=1 Tax=Glossina austeni TaxID=7395 RepID=A0A1A9VYE7_GLOAU